MLQMLFYYLFFFCSCFYCHYSRFFYSTFMFVLYFYISEIYYPFSYMFCPSYFSCLLRKFRDFYFCFPISVFYFITNFLTVAIFVSHIIDIEAVLCSTIASISMFLVSPNGASAITSVVLLHLTCFEECFYYKSGASLMFITLELGLRGVSL